MYAGEFNEFKTLNTYNNLKNETPEAIAGTLFKIAEMAYEPSYALSGIDTALIDEMLNKEISPIKIASKFKKELRPVVFSYIASKQVNIVPEGFPLINVNPYKRDELAFAFKYKDMMGIKKLNVNEAKDYEGSAFFSFVFDNALKYGFRVLGVKPEPIKLEGRGLNKFLSFKPKTIEEMYGYYLACKELVFNKKAAWLPFPSPIMLVKAYPDLKVRRR